MNFYYKIKGEELILSEEEHKKILQAQEQGVDMVYLRDGSLGINPKRIDIFRETTKMTEEQENHKENQMLLKAKEMTETVTNGRNPFREAHAEFYKKMGWEDKSRNSQKEIKVEELFD